MGETSEDLTRGKEERRKRVTGMRRQGEEEVSKWRECLVGSQKGGENQQSDVNEAGGREGNRVEGKFGGLQEEEEGWKITYNQET
jgi:hypothetical protein